MNNVIEQFNQLMTDGKIKSINNAAKAMDVSAGALSQYLKGKYIGDNAKIESKVISYLQLIKERELSGDDEINFIEGLKNTQMVLDVVRLTHIRKTIGLITGRAGYGKTLALKSYCKRNPDAIYIEVDNAFNAKELMKEINAKCGYYGIGQLNTLKNLVIEKLTGTGRVLVIDQAEYLNDRALDLLRTIHDRANVGVILSGLPVLLSNIKGTNGIHEQVYTRIGVALQLEPPSSDDLKKLIGTYIKSSIELDSAFITESRRNPRVLYILLRESKRIAKNKGIPINPDIVKVASRQLVK